MKQVYALGFKFSNRFWKLWCSFTRSDASLADVTTSPIGFFQIGFHVREKVHATAVIFAAANAALVSKFGIVRRTSAFLIHVNSDGSNFSFVLADPIRQVLNIMSGFGLGDLSPRR
jgi:hypothetical protein